MGLAIHGCFYFALFIQCITANHINMTLSCSVHKPKTFGPWCENRGSMVGSTKQSPLHSPTFCWNFPPKSQTALNNSWLRQCQFSCRMPPRPGGIWTRSGTSSSSSSSSRPHQCSAAAAAASVSDVRWLLMSLNKVCTTYRVELRGVRQVDFPERHISSRPSFTTAPTYTGFRSPQCYEFCCVETLCFRQRWVATRYK